MLRRSRFAIWYRTFAVTTVLGTLVFMAAGGAVQAATSVTFWYPLGGVVGDEIEALVADFNESQDEVKVEAVFSGNYWQTIQKLQTSLMAGNPPDVAVIEINAIPQFIASGAVTSLDSRLSQQDRSDFVSSLLYDSSYDGSQWGVPFVRSTPIFYYNLDMIEAAGLDGPPQTMQEVREYAKALVRRADGRVRTWGMYLNPFWWNFLSFLWSNGGQLLTDDNTQVAFAEPPGVEVLKFLSEMIYVDQSATPSSNWGQMIQDFALGKVAMVIHTTGSLARVRELADFEWGVSFVPPFKEYAVPAGGGDVVILKNSPPEKQAAAWKFVHWLTDTEQTARWARATGYLPVRYSAVKLAEMQAYYDEHPEGLVAFEQLEYVVPTPRIPENSQILDALREGIEQAYLNQADPAQALAAAARKAQAVLDR